MNNFDEALDAFHLQSFRNELYGVLLKSWVELGRLHKMADELAAAEELPDTFRQHYSDICKQLPDLVKRLYRLSLAVSPHHALEDEVQAPFLAGIPEAQVESCIGQLRQAEDGLIDKVDQLGNELGRMARPAVNVEEGVTADVTLSLQQSPTRQCYSKLNPKLAERDLFIAFSKFRADSTERLSTWPAFLLDHRMVPRALLPLIESVRFELRLKCNAEHVFKDMNSIDSIVLPTATASRERTVDTKRR